MAPERETIDFGAERERLRAEMEETAEEQAEIALEDETGVAGDYLAQLQQRGTALDSYQRVLSNGQIDAESVTLRELTYGDSRFLQDFLDDHDGVHYTPAFIALGTVDGPYLRHDPESAKRNPDDLLETVREVNDLPIPFVRWLEERLGELSHLGEDMGNRYTDLLVDRLTTEATGEDG